MNQKIKNYLGISLIIVALALAYGSMSYANTYSKSIGLSARSFTAEGSGNVFAVPDVAQFTFGVVTEGGKDLSALQDENAGKINQAIGFLKDNGVEEKDIETQGLSIRPRYSNYNCYRSTSVIDGGVEPLIYLPTREICPPQEIIGYTINQNVRVKVRDMDRVGDIFAGVIDNGANTASGLSFTIDDTTELENQARAEAIKEAQEKAKAIADAGGFRLGKLLSIDEIGNYPGPYYAIGGAEGLRADSAAPTIEPGEEEIIVNVNLRYEIR